MLSPFRGRTLVALLGLGVLTLACSSESDLLTAVGTGRVLFVDPGLQVQRIKDPEPPVQYASWGIRRADYIGPEGEIYHLRAGDRCFTIDRATTLFPLTDGKCEAGLAFESRDEEIPIRLDVKFTMEVRRAKPVDLPPGDDYDGDGIPNSTDPCPLLAPITERGGIEDCSVVINGEVVADHDGDGVVDALDNCVYIPNEDQEDTADAIPDGIGDACVTQRARVALDGSVEMELPVLGPQLLAQPFLSAAFFIVDTASSRVLDCDWDAGRCALDADEVRFCIKTDALGAALGCP